MSPRKEISFIPTKEITKEIRLTLKRKLKECKFSVRGDNYSMGRSIYVTLVHAPFEVFRDPHKKYLPINHFHVDHPGLSPKGLKLARIIVKIANRRNWNRSDIGNDYHDTNYGLTVSFGAYDRPFLVSPAQASQ